MVRVHSGAAGVGSSAPAVRKAVAAAGDRQLGLGDGGGTAATAGAGRFATFAPSQTTTAAVQQRPYQWIAKAVASRSLQEQQQPQPQFDAFDEPHGEWYYAGT